MWKLDYKESWALKNWCFWTVVLEKTPWTARRSNQSILKEISPEYSLQGLMLKLKLQHFGHLMWRTDSLEKTLMLGKIEGRRKRGWQDEMVGWHHWLMDMRLSKLWELVMDRETWMVEAMGSQRLIDWTHWWQTVRRFLERLKVKWPLIPKFHLGVSLKEMKSLSQRDVYTPMFTAAFS